MYISDFLDWKTNNLLTNLLINFVKFIYYGMTLVANTFTSLSIICFPSLACWW